MRRRAVVACGLVLAAYAAQVPADPEGWSFASEYQAVERLLGTCQYDVAAERLQQLAGKHGDQHKAAIALARAALAWHRGLMDEATLYLDAALGGDALDFRSQVVALGMRGRVLVRQQRYEAAVDVFLMQTERAKDLRRLALGDTDLSPNDWLAFAAALAESGLFRSAQAALMQTRGSDDESSLRQELDAAIGGALRGETVPEPHAFWRILEKHTNLTVLLKGLRAVPATRVAQPGYPRQALREGIEGYATVQLRIRPDGRPEDVRVADSTPAGVFDKVTVEAVRKSRFEPLYRDCKPESGDATYTIWFKIGG